MIVIVPEKTSRNDYASINLGNKTITIEKKNKTFVLEGLVIP